MWDSIVFAPDYCLSIYFANVQMIETLGEVRKHGILQIGLLTLRHD